MWKGKQGFDRRSANDELLPQDGIFLSPFVFATVETRKEPLATLATTA